MAKFRIIRSDINKIVLREVEADNTEHAVGKYISALMLAGLVKMDGSGLVADTKNSTDYTLSNGWRVRADLL
jgi:hypothetical protein